MYICIYVCVCVDSIYVVVCCQVVDYFQNGEAYCSSCSYHLGAKESCNVFCTQRSVSFHHHEPRVLTFCWAAAVLQVNPELQLDQCDTFWFDFKSHIKRLFFAIWTWAFLSFRLLSFGKGPWWTCTASVSIAAWIEPCSAAALNHQQLRWLGKWHLAWMVYGSGLNMITHTGSHGHFEHTCIILYNNVTCNYA